MPQTAALLELEQTDAHLAARLARGDDSALEPLMRRHNQTLYRTARSILHDDAEAEDAVQEAYLRAYRAIHTFRGQARISTWLVRITANEALGRLRRSKRRAQVISLHDDRIDPDRSGTVADPAVDAADLPEGAALRGEVRRLIEAHIDRLPEAFRAVFVLRAIEEFTVDETAESLGLPAATVRTRFFRARGLLREALAREIDLNLETAFGFAGARCDRIVAGVLRSSKQERAPFRCPSTSIHLE